VIRRRRIQRRLETFIVEQLLDQPFDGRDPLAANAVDSLGIEQLVQYIEEQYAVKLSDEDLVPESFESVPALAGLVDRKLRSVRA
jgi:acyl carrier protein